MTEARLPTYFLSHGGGPWPYMDGPFRAQYNQLERSIQDIPRQIAVAPRAVLIVTSHWEETEFTVSTGVAPPMIYDFYGFPQSTYHVRYPAPGSPALADRVRKLLTDGGIECHCDDQRGFDHGTFSLMQPLRPEADWPVVQLSLCAGLDPHKHIAAGQLLAPLREEGILIIGSGLSYHNLRMLGPEASEPSRQFDRWLRESLIGAEKERRYHRLENWATQAPAARIAHPHEDHLLPLMVAVGAAIDENCTCVYHEDRFFGTMTVSSFRFGKAAGDAMP